MIMLMMLMSNDTKFDILNLKRESKQLVSLFLEFYLCYENN